MVVNTCQWWLYCSSSIFLKIFMDSTFEGDENPFFFLFFFFFLYIYVGLFLYTPSRGGILVSPCPSVLLSVCPSVQTNPMLYDNLSCVSQNLLKFNQLFTGEERRIPFIFDDFRFCRSRVIGLDMPENRIFTLCRMIT